MNRAERRKQEKKFRKAGMNKAEAKLRADLMKSEPLREGQKVKLNYELMKRHPMWKNQEDEFKEWVVENKDKIFTVEYEPTRKQTNSYDKTLNVNFVEDTHEPKWLLHTDTLIPVPMARIKLNDGTETLVELDGITDVNDPEIQKRINDVMEENNVSSN